MSLHLLVNMSDAMFTLWLVLSVTCLAVLFLVALFTVIIVLFQKSNSDGIQGITASSETFFGKHKGKSIESRLKKWTWVCLGVLTVLAISLFIVQLLVS